MCLIGNSCLSKSYHAGGGALKGGSWSSPDIYQHKLEVGCVGVMLGAIVESLWKNEFGFWKIRFW